ncbi:hypothetical protein D3C76_619010 [compost metagenome]
MHTTPSRSTCSTRPTYTPRLFGKVPSTSFLLFVPCKNPCVNPREKLCCSSRISSFEGRVSSPSKYRSIALRYLLTTLATYSGLFKRPSILKEVTPASISSGIISMAAKSLGESKYATSPIGFCTPSTIKSYGKRQA